MGTVKLSKKFKSGSFTETSNIDSKKKEDSVKTVKNNTKKKDEFHGQALKGDMYVPGSQSVNVKVLRSGNLYISGIANGTIYIDGGNVYISGTFNGNVIFNSGDLYISGTATGTIKQTGGNICSSGSNNLKYI